MTETEPIYYADGTILKESEVVVEPVAWTPSQPTQADVLHQLEAHLNATSFQNITGIRTAVPTIAPTSTPTFAPSPVR